MIEFVGAVCDRPRANTVRPYIRKMQTNTLFKGMLHYFCNMP